MISVCLLYRPGARAGGDWVALNHYADALLRADVEPTLVPADQRGVRLDVFTYTHLWAACSPDWGLPAARYAKSLGVKFIITPFWWSRAERQAFYGMAGQDLYPGYTEHVGETLKLADVIFSVTNSEAEQCRLIAPGARFWNVPMGTDPTRANPVPPDDYVLCVGRIEPHKNQHSLAAVCKGLNRNLILLGGYSNADYIHHIIENYGPEIISNASDETRNRYMSYARVHALPSFFENPGLVHGEALAAGVPAVMGSHGCEPEFYGSRGIYCDPTSVESIAQAITEAWDRPRVPCTDLPTWDDAARRALEWMRQ